MAKRKDRDGIYVRKDRPGFWGSYVDPDGVRHREKLNGAQTLTQARDALSLLERKAEKNHALEIKDVSDISTSDLLERFRRFQKAHLRPSTYQRLDGILSTLKANLPAKAKAITRNDVSKFIETRMSGEDAVAPATVRKEVQALKYCLKLAVEQWEYLRVNPAQSVKLPKVSDEKPRFLTPNELRATLEAAPEWMRAPIALAAATGMRRGELLALRWLDIDFGLKLIFLRSATTKTAEPRAIPLTPAAQLVLESLSHGKPGAHVFADVDPARLSVYIRRVFASLGIENASFHTLRHTAASWMVQAGVSLYSTGQVLGHKTPRMTQRYAHLAPEHLATAAGKLSDALMKALPGTAQTVSDEEPQ